MLPDLEGIRAGLPNEHVVSSGKLGLELAPSIDRATWARLVGHLAKATRGITENSDTLTAWIGDVLAYGGGKYRGQIAEYAHAAGLHPTTLRNAKLVCSRIPLSRRRDTLSWSHHCEIAKAFAEVGEIDRWLQLAEAERLSRAELRQRIRAARKSTAASVCSDDEVAPFALLRELRALDRLLRHKQAAWQSWSPAVCQRALSEITALERFVAQLRTRAAHSRWSSAS